MTDTKAPYTAATQQPLHIVHIVDLRVVGGIERIAVEFIRATPQLRHSLVLFDKRIAPTLHTMLASLPQLAATHSAKHWHGVRLPKAWRDWNRRRLIHHAQAEVLLNWSQILDMRHLRLPIVFYEHGSAWERYEAQRLQACYEPIHHAIAVSQAAKRMLQLHHHLHQPCEVIENTVFEPVSVQQTAKTLRPEGLVLGAAGRLVKRKNFAVLIHAVKILREQGLNVQLLLAGSGPEQHALQGLIERLQLQQHVTLLGYQRDMAAFFQQLDVFVCSSIWESYGLVAIEAFAAGVPVVGANNDGLPEVVTHGVNGYCLVPTLNVQQYEHLLGEAAAFAGEVCYQASTDALRPQQSLCPHDLAACIAKIWQRPEHYTQMSQAALDTAMRIKPFSQLVAEVTASVRKACHD